MSDNETFVVKFELPQVVNAALIPLASAIGETLATGWKGLTIGVDLWYGKKQIEKEHNLKLYADEIQSSLSTVPEENLQEPKMNILGPSLEASKYYFEENWYRSMFAKLIAGSCDNRLNEKIHPFFVEAIKQMTTRDAYLLSLFSPGTRYPVVNYRYVKKDNSETTALENVFYEDSSYKNPNYFSVSITNLVRLGFLNVDFSRFFADDSMYNKYLNDPTFIALKDHVRTDFENSDNNTIDMKIQKGILSTTPLGNNFIDICI